jgi:hypothetical protein
MYRIECGNRNDRGASSMRSSTGRWIERVRAIGLVVTLAVGVYTARMVLGADTPGDPRIADYFGFLPIEVYKLDPRINGLLVSDLDGDKIDDIAVVNNGRSRIDLLLSTKKPVEDTEPRKKKGEANEVESDRRMRLVSLSVNKEIVSLISGDFNADGKADLAYYGEPAELVVLLSKGDGKFADPKKINTGEAIQSQGALAVGDLNHDGRDDLALITQGEVITILQGEGGKLGEPERIPHTAQNPRMVKAVDLDGDGGDDLILLDGGPDDPIRVRFSGPGGTLGPEQRFAIEPLRAYAFGQMDGRPGSELLTIEQQSGRVRVHTLDVVDDDDTAKRGRLLFYPLPQGNIRGRSLDLGDLDGDGLVDVVASDPGNAQFFVFRQAKGSGLTASQGFPNLVGGRTVKLADLDGDHKAEVYVLSEQERQIGRSVYADGRLTFPAPLPLSGDPVALEVADLDGDKIPEIVYVTRDKAPTSTADLFSLRALKQQKAGGFVPFRWGQTDSVVLNGISDVPTVQVLDVNRDGQPDFLCYTSGGPRSLLLGRPGEPPAAAGGGLGPLSDIGPAGLTEMNLDGPALVLAQKTYARNLFLDKDGHWVVKDQYNTARNSASVLGAAAIDTDGDGVKEIALLDRTSKSLLYLAKRNGVYRPSGMLSVGPFDLQKIHVADLNGDGRDDLLLAGAERFGVVLTGSKGQRLKTIHSYEPTREDAKLSDLIVGDMNADGQPDITLIDPGEHFVEIVTKASNGELEKGLAFKVFERKSMRNMSDLVEPRDLAIGDVDGDSRTDLVLIVHDRILVYRQDAGSDRAKAAAKK